VLDSSGNATFAGTPVPNSSFLRNRIINGDMRIDQRNAGATVTPATGAYTVDRFAQTQNGGGVVSYGQSSTVPTGFTKSLVATVTTPDSSIAASDVYRLYQYIEGFNCLDLAFGTASASTVTVSFWVRSSITGTYCLGLQNGTYNRGYAANYTINSANTWEYKTVTIAGDTTGTWATDNTAGIAVFWDLGSGSSYNQTASTWAATNTWKTSSQTAWISTSGATFYLTGVQLEVGTAATPFERRQYGQELALCQRYYEKSYNINTVPGSSSDSLRFEGLIAFAKPVSSFNEEFTTRFSVGKRSSTTVVVFNPDTGASGGYRDFTNSVNRTGISILDAGTSGFKALITDAVQEGGGFQFTAAAEL
jgi:hypothetical protein